MKNLLMSLTALLLSILVLTACDPPWLPKESESGRYSFGCKINGKRVQERNWRNLRASISQGGMLIRAFLPQKKYFEFTFHNGITGPKVIPITAGCVQAFDWTCIIYTPNDRPFYRPVNDPRNYFEITELNLENGGFVSGLFDFVLVNEDDPTDTVFVTDGRFDIGF